MIHIETNRLILREIEEYDVQDIFELDSDPEVHKFLGGKTTKSMDESLSIIRNWFSPLLIGQN